MNPKHQLSAFLIKRKEKQMSVSACAEHQFVNQLPHDKLDTRDINEIHKLWNGAVVDLKAGYGYFEMFKHLTAGSFDPRFVPTPYLYPAIIRALNPSGFYKGLAHKAMYPAVFRGLNMPQTLVQCVNYLITDTNHKFITNAQAVDLIANNPQHLIIKPISDTSGGAGVKKFTNISKEKAAKLLESYRGNFTVQTFLYGSDTIRSLNPASLNTMRIMTLAMNGEISLLPSMIRMGTTDKIVDNLSSGGMCVGIKPDGYLYPKAYSYVGEGPTENNGVKFTDFRIPNFDKIRQFVFDAHARIPLCRLAAWDIALDENDSPVLIEVNLYWPSALPQICCATPTFADRTEEVIDLVRHVRKKNPTFFER